MADARLLALRATGNLRLRKVQLEIVAEIDTDSILEFATIVQSATTRQVKKLVRGQKREAKKAAMRGLALEVISTFAEEQLDLAAEVGNLAHRLAIVALFGKVELSYKTMIEVAIPNVDAKDLYKWADVKRELARKGIDLKAVTSFAEVNQFRCLNNSIKHGRRVGAELARTGWGLAHEPIDSAKCAEVLYPFVDHVESFIKDLKKKLLRLIV